MGNTRVAVHVIVGNDAGLRCPNGVDAFGHLHRTKSKLLGGISARFFLFRHRVRLNTRKESGRRAVFFKHPSRFFGSLANRQGPSIAFRNLHALCSTPKLGNCGRMFI